MDLGLTAKVMLVSGGAGAIGSAIARQSLKEGAIPVVVDRDEEKGVQLEQELSKGGRSCLFIGADLSDAAGCQSIIQQVLDTFGRLDVLVNNAGGNDFVGLEAGNLPDFEKSLRSNLHHYYALAHFGLPALKKVGGNIVNVSSKTAVTGQGNTSGYVAAKAAILGLTREWALELAPYGMRANAVIPAEVFTPFFTRWAQQYDNPEEKLRGIGRLVPLGQRFTTVDEIASTVLFLASEKASHITGQHIYVDGGYTHLDRAYTSPSRQEGFGEEA